MEKTKQNKQKYTVVKTCKDIYVKMTQNSKAIESLHRIHSRGPGILCYVCKSHFIQMYNSHSFKKKIQLMH